MKKDINEEEKGKKGRMEKGWETTLMTLLEYSNGGNDMTPRVQTSVDTRAMRKHMNKER
jgi:hypothetical protein